MVREVGAHCHSVMSLEAPHSKHLNPLHPPLVNIVQVVDRIDLKDLGFWSGHRNIFVILLHERQNVVNQSGAGGDWGLGT